MWCWHFQLHGSKWSVYTFHNCSRACEWAWKILGNCAILADGHASVTAVPVKEGVEIWQQSQVGWGHKYNCPFGLFGDRVFWYLLIFVHGNMWGCPFERPGPKFTRNLPCMNQDPIIYCTSAARSFCITKCQPNRWTSVGHRKSCSITVARDQGSHHSSFPFWFGVKSIRQWL